MTDIIMQLGVGGIFACLVIKMVLDFLAKKKDVEKDSQYRMIKDLWEWHKPDQQGEQTWKNKHMIESVERVAKSIDSNTKVLDRLLIVLDRSIERNKV